MIWSLCLGTYVIVASSLMATWRRRHVNAVCRTAIFHIRKIAANIRRYVTPETTKKVLDRQHVGVCNQNATLTVHCSIDCPRNKNMQWLPIVQNWMGRLIGATNTICHFTQPHRVQGNAMNSVLFMALVGMINNKIGVTDIIREPLYADGLTVVLIAEGKQISKNSW